MAATVMMYVLPMMLGQTYNLGKDQPGIMIFPPNIEAKAMRIERYLTDSQYRMVDNVEDMRDFLDASGKLSLKIKSGLVDIGGEGQYLKDSSSKSNALEILVKLHFETVTLSIPSSASPNASWSTLPEQFLGTHYCRSLTYGGDLVASIRIAGSDRSDLERIKGAINAAVKTSGGAFEGDIKGKLEILKQNAEGSSSMEIDYYASVPLQGVAYTVEGLIKLVDDFPQHVQEVNGGLGNPVKMELYPLNYLKGDYKSYFEDRTLTDELDDLEIQFDDLRNTRHQLRIWITQLPPSMPDSVHKKIIDFTKSLDSIYAVYMKTIAELDVRQGASTQGVRDAFEAYRGKGNMLPEKYFRKLQKLQRETYQEAPELRPKVGGATYVRWGRSECSSPETAVTMSGVAVASDINKDGGSSDFTCSPLLPDSASLGNDFDGKSDDYSPYLHISPLQYRGTMEKFQSMSRKNLACVLCRSFSRTALLTKMAARSCPEGWVKEYEGYLMAPGSFAKGEYVCVDKDFEEPKGSATFGSSLSENKQHLKEVSISCGSLPCEPYEESKPIQCVVCTI